MSRLRSARSASARRTMKASRPWLRRLKPERPGCASPAGPKNWPSLVDAVSSNAVDVLRGSSGRLARPVKIWASQVRTVHGSPRPASARDSAELAGLLVRCVSARIRRQSQPGGAFRAASNQLPQRLPARLTGPPRFIGVPGVAAALATGRGRSTTPALAMQRRGGSQSDREFHAGILHAGFQENASLVGCRQRSKGPPNDPFVYRGCVASPR